jgi:hypothetical protein
MEADVFLLIGIRPIPEVQAPDLVRTIKAVQSGVALDIAKRCVQMTGQIFHYAVALGLADRNPAGDIKAGNGLPARRAGNIANSCQQLARVCWS